MQWSKYEHQVEAKPFNSEQHLWVSCSGQFSKATKETFVGVEWRFFSIVQKKYRIHGLGVESPMEGCGASVRVAMVHCLQLTWFFPQDLKMALDLICRLGSTWSHGSGSDGCVFLVALYFVKCYQKQSALQYVSKLWVELLDGQDIVLFLFYHLFDRYRSSLPPTRKPQLWGRSWTAINHLDIHWLGTRTNSTTRKYINFNRTRSILKKKNSNLPSCVDCVAISVTFRLYV